jgi:hypothetical protein
MVFPCFRSVWLSGIATWPLNILYTVMMLCSQQRSAWEVRCNFLHHGGNAGFLSIVIIYKFNYSFLDWIKSTEVFLIVRVSHCVTKYSRWIVLVLYMLLVWEFEGSISSGLLYSVFLTPQSFCPLTLIRCGILRPRWYDLISYKSSTCTCKNFPKSMHEWFFHK